MKWKEIFFRFRVYGFLWILFPALAHGQQVPQYMLSLFSQVEFNPAYAGSDGTLSFTGATRRQWNSLPGSPIGYHGSVQLPLNYLSSGVGLSMMQDQVGILDHLEITAMYSYHIPISRTWTLSGGLAGGIFQSGLDGSKIRTPGGQYPQDGSTNHQDDLLTVGQAKALSPVVHAGIMVKSQTWEGGVSAKYLQGGRLLYKGTDKDAGVAFQPHLFAHVSYKGYSGSLEWRPVLAFRSDLKELQIDAQCYFTWRDRFILGGGYRGWSKSSQDAYLIAAGVRISDRFLVMYGFEGGVSPIRNAHQGSFELMLRYDLVINTGSGNLPGRIFNPRFL